MSPAHGPSAAPRRSSSSPRRARRRPLQLAGLLAWAAGCQDYRDFSTRDDHFGGVVSSGEFVRAGLSEGLRACVTLDGSSLQTNPGTIATSDGWLPLGTPLRPLPQVQHDALSTLDFGDGRVRTYLYAATPPGENDVTVFLSLMHDGKIEVRLLRGGPRRDAPGTYVFGVFPLGREEGACQF